MKTKSVKRKSRWVPDVLLPQAVLICVPLEPDRFVPLQDFPDECDSKEDECFLHTTEVIRRRLLINQTAALTRIAGRYPQQAKSDCDAHYAEATPKKHRTPKRPGS